MTRREGHRHHTQFPRKVHDAHPATREIRRNHWLIPRIEEIGHAALHSEIIVVPVLDRFTAGRVLSDFQPIEGNHIASMEELMRSIERAIKHPKSGELEQMNAQVAIHALELQIPYIRESLIPEEY